MGWGESLDPPDSPVCRLCICGGTPQRTGLHSGLVCFYFLQLLFFGLQWKMCTTPAAVESWQLAASREPWKLEVRPPAQWLEAAAPLTRQGPAPAHKDLLLAVGWAVCPRGVKLTRPRPMVQTWEWPATSLWPCQGCRQFLDVQIQITSLWDRNPKYYLQWCNWKQLWDSCKVFRHSESTVAVTC